MNDQIVPEFITELLTPSGWLLFATAMVVLILIWTGRITQHFSRAAMWTLLTGVAVVLTTPPLQILLLIAGLTVATLQLRRPRSRPGIWGTARREKHEPWDQEAALMRMCGGDRATVERLIRHEMARNPSLSRAGAAMAAATRLRHER